jgi:PAS domain S-box-containing protein
MKEDVAKILVPLVLLHPNRNTWCTTIHAITVDSVHSDCCLHGSVSILNINLVFNFTCTNYSLTILKCWQYLLQCRNRYAEHMYGYSASEAVGQDAVELLVHPDDAAAANTIIGNIFMGKCWRGKFPVKNKSGERFIIVANNTPLYDDDGSLVGLICLSVDTRTVEEIIGPSTSGKPYTNSVKPCFQVNDRPKCGSLNKNPFDSQQSAQPSITSKITTLVCYISEQTEEMTICSVVAESFSSCISF